MRRKKIQNLLTELAADFKWSQLFCILGLMVFSSLFIYTATARTDGQIPQDVVRQWIWFAVGLGIYFVVALMDYHWLCKNAWIIYFAVLGSLIWVLKFGKEINGARRWIALKSISIQPSEFAKISVLLLLCYYLSRSIGLLSDWRRILFAFLLAAIPAALIEKQPDLGTALVVVAVFLAILFVSGAPLKLFAYITLVGVLVLGAVGYDIWRYVKFQEAVATETLPPDSKFKSFLHLNPYQFNRILVWVIPDSVDRRGVGWNREQALIAIGSGGFQGKGWMKGNVTRGGYLPRMGALNDFIFAVLAEESGFVGSSILLGLYAMILWGGIRIAKMAQDALGMLLALGSTFLLFFHIFMNMGMAMGILPVVGVPLPLVSYGGSFVLVCMICLGILQSVWLHRKPY